MLRNRHSNLKEGHSTNLAWSKRRNPKDQSFQRVPRLPVPQRWTNDEVGPRLESATNVDSKRKIIRNNHDNLQA